MNRDDVEIRDRKRLYKGFFEMSLYAFRHRLFEGGWSKVMDREIFERDPVAAVLPYDPARDAVVLIEQFRPGVMAAGHDNAWTIEVVAGIIEDSESPEAMCRREAVEEAGCTLGELVPIANFFPSPGGCTEYLYLYCGRVDSTGLGGIHGLDHEEEDIRVFVVGRVDSTGLGGIHGLDHEEEDIRVFVESTNDALRMMERGEIGNATAIVALQWLALHRDELRTRWA